MTTGAITGGTFTGTLTIVNSSNVTLFSSSITGTVSVVGGTTFVNYTSGSIVWRCATYICRRCKRRHDCDA